MTASALSLGLALPTGPVIAQDKESALEVEQIVVTARRREEELQDVPVSLTYFDQKQLDNLNMFQAADLATYTPALSIDNRFGSDSTNFVIRGFSQELRTTAAVGVYFAEVVAPRGANTTRSGDGAGPGDMFDLENIQVLKGPQGTLFGRNTTGGSVLLTPKKPTDEFEGYAEVSMGNYDMTRTQAVLNIPVSDTFRMRLGVDRQKRDGYLENFSGIGPSDMEDIDYVALRASFVWDITEALENYTILKYNDSDNNASPYSLFACNTTPGSPGFLFGFGFCRPDLARRVAAGKFDEYDIYSFVPDSRSEIEQAQIINTTSWEVNDQLTVKNILSYAEFESRQNFAIYGTDWRLPGSGLPIQLQMVGSPDFKTTDQRSFVEELQFQGSALEDRLDWQAGLYFERSTPINEYGSFNPAFISCDLNTISSPDINAWRCNNVMGIGTAYHSPGGVKYKNEAIYAEGNYHFTDQWTMTLGLRYTEDETTGETQKTVGRYPTNMAGGWFPASSITVYPTIYPKSKSDAATWNLGLQYKPTTDLMLYGKYTRGYRQGSVNLDSVPEWAVHGPESVDTYEIGAKGNFGGPFPGTFGIAAYYNDFKDQQIQFGYMRLDNGIGSTSILNAGQSTLQGVELDLSLLLTDNLNLSIAYAWVDTEVDQFDLPSPASIPPAVRQPASPTAVQGERLPGTPPNKLVATANYRLPVDASWGDITASVTYTFTDDTQWVARRASPYAITEAYSLLNFNLSWEKIVGSPVDLLLFVTNAFDREYTSLITGSWNTFGLETGRPGIPRMYGARLRYSF